MHLGESRHHMEIYLRQGHSFSVPVTVADHMLGLASHDQLKVLLYILCHAGEPLSAAGIAQCCKVSEDAVEEAVMFWQDANVLLSAPEQATVQLQAKVAPMPKTAPAEPQKQETVERPPHPVISEVKAGISVQGESRAPIQQNSVMQLQASSSNFALMPSEIAERIRQNKILAEMFRSAEQIAGRMLNNTEQKSLIWMHEYLGLEPDLILMLAAFCVQNDSFQVRYMEKIAIEWQERGVMTHALVEADIRRRTEARSYNAMLMRMFEMHRQPTAKQQAFFDQWRSKGYAPELIQLAYEKTRDQIDDKLNFNYLNGILERWDAAGVRDVQAAQKLDDAFYAARKRNQKQKKGESRPHPAVSAGSSAANSSIDMNDVEKLMNPF